MSITTMRPRRVGEILDGAIKVYVRHARTLMGLALAVVVPLQVLVGIVLLSTYTSGSDIPGGTGLTVRPGQDRAAVVGAEVVLVVAQLVATSLVTAASVKAVSDAYLDQPTGIGISLRYALRRLPAVVAMDILVYIGLAVAFILLIVPGIYFYAAWSVAMPALLIERYRPIRALRRSRALVKGRWWPTAAVLLISNLMVWVLSFAIGALLGALSALPSNPSLLFSVAVVTVSSAVGAVITYPFRGAVTTILYYDLRVRREGYDLELLADQLGLPAERLGVASANGDGAAGVGRDGWAQDLYGLGPESVGRPGGPPYWPPPPDWRPPQ